MTMNGQTYYLLKLMLNYVQTNAKGEIITV